MKGGKDRIFRFLQFYPFYLFLKTKKRINNIQQKKEEGKGGDVSRAIGCSAWRFVVVGVASTTISLSAIRKERLVLVVGRGISFA